jgi:predicted kinase
MNDRVYSRLLDMAKTSILSGVPAVIDATFLKRKRRAAFEGLALEFNVPYRILNCEAPFAELCQRIEARVSDPSDATIDVLKMQINTHDPLTEQELEFAGR